MKKGSKYSVHIKIEYGVPDVPVAGVLGVDLGVRRHAATVLLSGEKPNRLTPRSFLTIRDGEKKNRLDGLNRLVSELQRAEKYDTLRRLRHKRKQVAEYFDRLSAKTLADMSGGVFARCWLPEGRQVQELKVTARRS